MSGPDTEPAGATHRARWRRFSPSMGWRAFWSEIVIVVLGVVIALAANEAVQEWNWRQKVADAETRLQGDIAWAFLWGAEAYVSQPCIDAQLAALSRNVLESGDTLVPQPVITANTSLQYVVRMPNRPHRFPVWDTLVADGTAAHFAPRRQAYLGRISIELALARDRRAEASLRSRNAYESLINSGRLGLLKNRELARHIQTYYGNYDDLLDTQTNVFRIFRTEGVVHQQYPMGLSVFDQRPASDIVALARDNPGFAAYLRSQREWAILNWNLLHNSSLETKALRLAIDKELAAP